MSDCKEAAKAVAEVKARHKFFSWWFNGVFDCLLLASEDERKLARLMQKYVNVEAVGPIERIEKAVPSIISAREKCFFLFSVLPSLIKDLIPGDYGEQYATSISNELDELLGLISDAEDSLLLDLGGTNEGQQEG